MILNTQILNEKHLLNLWNNANYKITVDGGTNRWYKIANNFEKNDNIPETTQIIPDLISGDLDSIDSDVLNFFMFQVLAVTSHRVGDGGGMVG